MKPTAYKIGEWERKWLSKDMQEVILALEQENETLKDNVEFLHSCLDDRDKSIELMKEENKKLKEENNELKEKIKNMEKAEKRFFELMKNYVMNKKD